jgi:hypothetical protein
MQMYKESPRNIEKACEEREEDKWTAPKDP